MSKQILFLIFMPLIIISCNDASQSQKNTTMNKILLQLETEKKNFALNETISIKAILTNQSSDTLLINNRFLIGYEEQGDREIYFQIFSSDGRRYDLPKDHQADILPLAPSAANIQKLKPNELIKNDIELTSIYQIKECGKYKIVGVYESKPFENIQGIYQTPIFSDTLEIEIVK